MRDHLFQRILKTRLLGMLALAVDRFAPDKYNYSDMKQLGTKANLPDILAALLPHQIETIAQRTIGVPNGGRDEDIARLNEAGIHVTANFRSVPSTRYYNPKYLDASVQCPIARLWGEQTLTLPVYLSFTQDDQDSAIWIGRKQVYPLGRSRD